MRRVLHLKMVTQCAMLEDFGMFLVLADKVFPLVITLQDTNLQIGTLCIPHRGSRSIIPTECPYVSDTTEG